MNSLRDDGRRGWDGGGGSRYSAIALRDWVNGIWRINYLSVLHFCLLLLEHEG